MAKRSSNNDVWRPAAGSLVAGPILGPAAIAHQASSSEAAGSASHILARGSVSRRLAELTLPEWEQLAGNAGFHPETLAALCSASLRHLERFFRWRFGERPEAWMRERRCRRAAELIARGYSTKAAAEELGFANPAHFCHEFKKVYGFPPQSFAPGVRGGG